VVSHQTAPTEYLGREEVDPRQDGRVGLIELLPASIVAPFGELAQCRAVAKRFLIIRHAVAKVGQRADDPIVAQPEFFHAI